MATIVTKTIKSSGGDYTSLSAAEAAMQKDLVTADEIMTFECYAFKDTTAVTFDGWTTDASHYIHVYVPPAERHKGVWSEAAYRLVTATASGALRITDTDGEHILLEGAQVQNTSTGAGIEAASGTAGSNVQARDCIVSTVSASAITNVPRIRNTVALRSDATAGYCVDASPVSGATVEWYNITACGGLQTLYLYGGAATTGVTYRVKNCIAQNAGQYGFHFATDGEAGTWDAGTDLSNTATNHANYNATGNTTLTFLDAPRGIYALHPTADTAATGTGTDLSATFTTDIRGTTRDATWDIGAFAHTPLVTKTLKAAGGDYSSMVAWESARQADIVSDNYIEQLDCHAFDDTANGLVTIDGWATDATRFVIVRAVDNHYGKWSTAAYRLKLHTNGWFAFGVCEVAHLIGLQMYLAYDSTPPATNLPVVWCDNITPMPRLVMDRCILRRTGTNADGQCGFYSQAPSGDFYLTNNIVYGFPNSVGIGFSDGDNYHRHFVFNNTVYGCATGFQHGTWYPTKQSLYFTNNMSIGNTTAYNLRGDNGSARAVEDFADNIASDTSSPNNEWDSQTVVFADAAGGDFRLLSTDPGVDAGTDLSAYFTTDAAGNTRTGTWDIGAFEYVSSGATVTPALIAGSATVAVERPIKRVLVLLPEPA